ncbi:PAS domain S-box protein [Chitinophaga sp. MM2321]|uniref:PAS domain-containing sensor histidine kinase n=1 Tax=Chitinophaga sp. MM2321 TaxID=3137178 RepID=UPI0032D5988C
MYKEPQNDSPGKQGSAVTPIVDLLQGSEEQYQQLFFGFPVAMYSTNQQGYITSYNKAAAMLWGREPVIGVDLWCGSWKISRPDGSHLPLDSCPMAIALKEGRPLSGEEIIVERPDGERRNVRVHPRPIFDQSGKITGAVNMLIDFTEIKQSEQALQENERKLRQLADQLEQKVATRTLEVEQKNEALIRSEERFHKMIAEVEDYAILLLDKNGIIQNWNKGAEKIKGYKEEEIVGKSFRIFYLPADQQNKLPEKLIEEARTLGRASHEGWRLRKDGTAFWGSIVITALHDDQGNIIGFSKVTRDLTERKAAEDKMKQYAGELELQNKELQQFAYAAAHDMKEPLRKIQFYTTAIMGNEMVQLPGKEKNYLDRTSMAAMRMQELIEDLLTYTKMSTTAEMFEQVDLNKTLEEVCFSYQDVIDQTNTVIAAVPLPVITGIPFQIRQLFDNLIGNALKYHSPQRVLHIIINYERVLNPAEEAGSITAGQEMHKISIQDNGIGFEAEFSEIIFEMFERLHGRENYPGTGIGLSLCKKIMQNHKGFIEAAAIPGEGACFTFYIPCG